MRIIQDAILLQTCHYHSTCSTRCKSACIFTVNRKLFSRDWKRAEKTPEGKFTLHQWLWNQFAPHPLTGTLHRIPNIWALHRAVLHRASRLALPRISQLSNDHPVFILSVERRKEVPWAKGGPWAIDRGASDYRSYQSLSDINSSIV